MHAQIDTNGVNLHVVQAGPHDGPLVLLLHGFPEFWYGWRAQIDFLAQAGFRVWAPDQRGYNLSDKPDGVRAYGIDHLAADIVGLIDAAGCEKAVVVGHDWGGGVAWWTAIRHPQRVEKLVILNSPHPGVMSHMLTSNFSQLRKSWYMFAFQLPWLPEWLALRNGARQSKNALLVTSRPGTFSEDDLARYVEAWQRPNAMKSMIHWYRALFRSRPGLPGNVRVTVPTLILWGARDRFLGRELAAESAQHCDNAKLVMFEQASHWLQHEEADAVNRHIVDFARA